MIKLGDTLETVWRIDESVLEKHLGENVLNIGPIARGYGRVGAFFGLKGPVGKGGPGGRRDVFVAINASSGAVEHVHAAPKQFDGVWLSQSGRVIAYEERVYGATKQISNRRVVVRDVVTWRVLRQVALDESWNRLWTRYYINGVLSPEKLLIAKYTSVGLLEISDTNTANVRELFRLKKGSR